MGSLIPNYEYDIFISYRQKDNKQDGWVSEFVQSLKNEIEATFKEDITIYFDENPYDGLSETHDVDDSLATKLKCLIFIPIISKTYCDPNSFAWTNEFLTFNELAKNDNYGLKVVLPNGNTASRTLPIRIHDINEPDRQLVEEEIGFLRSIDFVYQSPGVIRPLRASEDDPTANLNKIFYRDQINKVASAIQEIIAALKEAETPTQKAVEDTLTSQPKKTQFRSELKRRNVLRASLVYLLTAVLIWKVADISMGLFTMPENTLQLIALALIVFFPIAILIAWLFERSPQGFISTGSIASRENPFTDAQKKPLTSNTFILLLVVSVAGLYLIFPQNLKNEAISESLVTEKSIAVLPFINMSNDEEQQYFADGQMEAILNHLSKIKEFRVISRNTMDQYKQTTKTTPMIAKELGVTYILEGSVQKQNNNVRITTQLIDGSSDTHLWSENYTLELKDIFTVQTEIAMAVVDEIKLQLTPEEKKILKSVPTSDLTAYDYYLKGLDYANRTTGEVDSKFAFQMFEKAVEIDPEYTLAWVGLASEARFKYWFHHDRTNQHLLRTKQYLDNAIALDPDILEVKLETGFYYYHCQLNYSKALKILEKLKTDYPKNASIHFVIGHVNRRMGQYERALEYYERSISLNPSDWRNWWIAGEALQITRQYDKSEKYFQTVINLNPSVETGYLKLAITYITTGRIDKARTLLQENNSFKGPLVEIQRINIELMDRNFEGALKIINSSSYEMYYSQFEYTPKTLLIGLVYRMMSNTQMATAFFEESVDYLENSLNDIENDSRIYSSLGIAYAGLGMKEKAIEAGKKALSIIDMEGDHMRGYNRELDMTRILVMGGNYDEAITKLVYLLGQHTMLSVELLKIDPFWDPLREHESFKALINNPKYQINIDSNRL